MYALIVQDIQGWATALLVVFRVIQGIAAGGEFSSAAVFVYEGVNTQERGKYAGYLVSGKFLSSIVPRCCHSYSNRGRFHFFPIFIQIFSNENMNL